MKYFFDTEFHEDGKAIELISIGIVCEDGREFYGISADADYYYAKQNDWLRKNVLSYLPLIGIDDGDTGPVGINLSHPNVLSRVELRETILAFTSNHTEESRPEFWAYYADYDWVVLCQLFGKMIDLPTGWPMFCLDIKQYAWSLGDPKLPEQAAGEHNALEDARWNLQAYEFLALREQSRNLLG